MSHRLPPSGVRRGWVWPDPSGSGRAASSSERAALRRRSSEQRSLATRLFGASVACDGALRGRVAFADGLFGVRRRDQWALRSPAVINPPKSLPRRPSGRQGDKRARAILRDRSRCMDAVAASSSPRACGSRLRAPACLRIGTAAPRKGRGHLGSSSEHPVRFVIGTRDGSPSGGPVAGPTGFGGCLRTVRLLPTGPIESVFGQVRMDSGRPDAFGREVGHCRSCCFGSEAALGRF